MRPSGLVSARGEAGVLALDVEEPDLPEIENAPIEIVPHLHAAALHIVGQMVDEIQAAAHRAAHPARPASRIRRRKPRRRRRSVDEINQAAADAHDGRHIQRLRAVRRPRRLGAQRDRTRIGLLASTTRNAIDGTHGPCASANFTAWLPGVSLTR